MTTQSEVQQVTDQVQAMASGLIPRAVAIREEPCPETLSRYRLFVEATGLGDGTGCVSFNKAITLILVAVFAFCALLKIDVPWALLSFGIILQGAGFGIKGYLAAVQQNKLEATLTASTAVALNTTLTGDLTEMTKAVIARRDAAQGIDPA